MKTPHVLRQNTFSKYEFHISGLVTRSRHKHMNRIIEWIKHHDIILHQDNQNKSKRPLFISWRLRVAMHIYTLLAVRLYFKSKITHFLNLNWIQWKFGLQDFQSQQLKSKFSKPQALIHQLPCADSNDFIAAKTPMWLPTLHRYDSRLPNPHTTIPFHADSARKSKIQIHNSRPEATSYLHEYVDRVDPH